QGGCQRSGGAQLHVPGRNQARSAGSYGRAQWLVLGIYAISLETGRLLWGSHGAGWWGRVVRLLDYMPDFTNEPRDTPLVVRSTAVVTQQGRILDLWTGVPRGRLKRDELKALHTEPAAPSGRSGRSVDGGIDCGRRGTIREQQENGKFFLEDHQGTVSWV